jgi:hypothetical protein
MVHVATFVIPWALWFLFISLPLSTKNHWCIAKMAGLGGKTPVTESDKF